MWWYGNLFLMKRCEWNPLAYIQTSLVILISKYKQQNCFIKDTVVQRKKSCLCSPHCFGYTHKWCVCASILLFELVCQLTISSCLCCAYHLSVIVRYLLCIARLLYIGFFCGLLFAGSLARTASHDYFKSYCWLKPFFLVHGYWDYAVLVVITVLWRVTFKILVDSSCVYGNGKIFVVL